jgi:hypothetical protein
VAKSGNSTLKELAPLVVVVIVVIVIVVGAIVVVLTSSVSSSSILSTILDLTSPKRSKTPKSVNNFILSKKIV